MSVAKDGKFFKLSELACKCGCGMNVKQELIDKLDQLRAAYGAPITVTSGARCLAHNTRIGGHPNSTHTRGEAADVRGADLNKLYAAAEGVFKSIGDARDDKRKFIHLDLRADKVRRWKY